MMRSIFVALLVSSLVFSCGEEAQLEEKKGQSDKKEAKEENPNTKHDARVEAVEVNDQLSLSHAHAFVLVDSLLKIPDLDDMSAQIPEVQVELVAIRHRVNDLQTELEGGSDFKKAVLNQLDFIDLGLKDEIPAMIKVGKSGKQKIADEMYFEWIKQYEEKSQLVLAAQIKFAEKHNIRIN